MVSAPVVLRLLTVLAAVCGYVGGAAFAASPIAAANAIVPAQEIVETLREPRTRGLVKVPGQASAPGPVVDRMAFPNIQFALNSARLLPQARRQLDEIGRALSDPALAKLHFEVRGHTDVSGSPRLNAQLSQARAAAVGAYLREQFAVNPQRLRLRGVGAEQLRKDLPAVDPAQRRVELIRR